jgi:hypothetical protein
MPVKIKKTYPCPLIDSDILLIKKYITGDRYHFWYIEHKDCGNEISISFVEDRGPKKWSDDSDILGIPPAKLDSILKKRSSITPQELNRCFCKLVKVVPTICSSGIRFEWTDEYSDGEKTSHQFFVSWEEFQWVKEIHSGKPAVPLPKEEVPDKPKDDASDTIDIIELE